MSKLVCSKFGVVIAKIWYPGMRLTRIRRMHAAANTTYFRLHRLVVATDASIPTIAYHISTMVVIFCAKRGTIMLRSRFMILSTEKGPTDQQYSGWYVIHSVNM